MARIFEISYFSKTDGMNKKEQIVAESKQEIIKEILLYRPNIVLIDVKEKSELFLKLLSFNNVTKKELSDFCFAVGKSLQIGLDILTTLEDLAESMENERFRLVIIKMIADLKNGDSLYESMKKYDIFPKSLLTMVKIGEKTGNLNMSFLNYGEYLEWLLKLRRAIKKALAYPIIASFAIFIALSVLVFFVLPKIVKAIKMLNIKGELPLPTKIIIFMTEHKSSIFIFVGALVAIYFLIKVIRILSDRGKYYTDYWLLKVPKIGEMVLEKHLAEDLKILHDVYQSGGSIVEALELIHQEMETNLYIKEQFRVVHESVMNGASLQEAFSKIEFFPRIVIRVIKIGEETGNINEALKRVIDLYETNVKTSIENLTLVIEPALQVVLGGILALIAAGVLMPVYQIVTQLGQR